MTIIQRYKNYRAMIAENIRHLFGRGYFHYHPLKSTNFRPGRVGSYFFDFRIKTKWPFNVDSDGIPVLSGRNQYASMIIIQKALGHYNQYQINHDNADLTQFQILCDWLVEKIHNNGAIPVWEGFEKDRLPKYSAMTQGMAAPLLTRAYLVTKRKIYLEKAQALITFMLSPRTGLTNRTDDAMILQEYPGSNSFVNVLNGWLYGLFGLYELNIVSPNKKYKKALEQSINSLSKLLPEYDTGLWSRYDLSGNIASTFYHRIHIVCLIALSQCFPKHKQLGYYAQKFEKYARRPLNRLLSQLIKIWQKILTPTENVLDY